MDRIDCLFGEGVLYLNSGVLTKHNSRRTGCRYDNGIPGDCNSVGVSGVFCAEGMDVWELGVWNMMLIGCACWKVNVQGWWEMKE